MSDIPSAKQYIQIEGSQLRAPVSESLAQTIGSSVNYLIDTTDAHETRLNNDEAAILALQTANKLQCAFGVSAGSAGPSTIASVSSSIVAATIVFGSIAPFHSVSLSINSTVTDTVSTSTFTTTGGSLQTSNTAGQTIRWSVFYFAP